MPEASTFEQPTETGMMPMSLAIQRPDEVDLLRKTGSPNLVGNKSLKLLDTVARLIKRREDSLGSEASASPSRDEDIQYCDLNDDRKLSEDEDFQCMWMNEVNGVSEEDKPVEEEEEMPYNENLGTSIAEHTESETDSLIPESQSEEEGELEEGEKPRQFPCVWLTPNGPDAPDHSRDGQDDKASEDTASPSRSLPCVWVDPESGMAMEKLPQNNKEEWIREVGVVDETKSQDASSPISSTPHSVDNLKSPINIVPQNSSTPLGKSESQSNQSFQTMTNGIQGVLTPEGLRMASGNTYPIGPNGNPRLPDNLNLSMLDNEGNTIEICPECQKVFKRKVYLQRHMEREHWSTAKVFKCSDCSYETKHQSNLSVHRRIHTGERPYHCGVCGQRYTQGHLLKSHIRSRHNGDMQFYNLDKKSDSTRGRKSLDIKHEYMNQMAHAGMHGIHPGLPVKQEKINTLVHQLEQQQKMSQLMSSPAAMSQFMNNMNYLNNLRPLMGSPLAFGNLMSPRLFGMPNGTPGPIAGLSPNSPMNPSGTNPSSNSLLNLPHMPPGMPLFANNPLALAHLGLPKSKAGLSPPSGGYPNLPSQPLGESGLKVPVKIEASQPVKQTGLPKPFSDDTVPQDLSMSKSSQSSPSAKEQPPVVSHLSPTPANLAPATSKAVNMASTTLASSLHLASTTSTSPMKLSSTISPKAMDLAAATSPNAKRMAVPSAMDLAATSFPHSMKLTLPPIPNMDEVAAATLQNAMKFPPPSLPNVKDIPSATPHNAMNLTSNSIPSSMNTASESSSRALDLAFEARPNFINNIPTGEKQLEDLPGTRFLEEEIAKLNRGMKRKASEMGCESDEEDCPHAKKLQELRRNIVRMLSVITPELSVEHEALDYASEQVDALLHEVIFSTTEAAAIKT